MTSQNSRPSIDHSILSPSGHVSKQARDAAMKREAATLFPPGFWDAPAKTKTEIAHEKAEVLRRTAANLRDLAARGVKPKAYLKAAAEFETKADYLEGKPDQVCHICGCTDCQCKE